MRIITCGDALFSSRNLAERLDKRLVAELANADAVFANAEFCCPKYTTPPAANRGYMTSVRPETLDEFTDLNIKLVSFANNHTGDYGWEGVCDTIEAAETRSLIYCGIGRSLEDARAARFLDTPQGRVAVIAVSTTRSELFAASSAGHGVAARPGLNPLRWGRSYVLPEPEFRQLQAINEKLGTAASAREGNRIEAWPDMGSDRFKFGSLFEENLLVECGERAYVHTFINKLDAEAVLNSIRDAANRADYVVFSIHTHEGEANNWYSSEVPSFIEKFSHQAIEAGASAVVGHGAHFLRGVEVYKKRPIFYNLGSLLMEFEAGESKIAPEMYEAYGFDKDALPSDLHISRREDKNGNRIGFYSEERFSHNCLAVCDFTTDDLQFKLLPLDLGLNRKRVLERGLPVIASAETGKNITRELTQLSKKYGTKFEYSENDGSIAIHSADIS